MAIWRTAGVAVLKSLVWLIHTGIRKVCGTDEREPTTAFRIWGLGEFQISFEPDDCPPELFRCQRGWQAGCWEFWIGGLCVDWASLRFIRDYEREEKRVLAGRRSLAEKLLHSGTPMEQAVGQKLLAKLG